MAQVPMAVSKSENETAIQPAQAEACALLLEVPGPAIASRCDVRVDVAVGGGCDGVRIDATERLERRSGFGARQQARTRAQEYFLRRRAAIEQDADEAVAHLIPVLRTPHDLLRRIRIEAVRGRVVEVAHQLQFRTLRHGDRLGELIAHLPFEVPVALQHRRRLTRGADDAQLEVSAAEMHVRLRVDQARVLAEGDLADNFRLTLAGWNREVQRRRSGVEEVARLRWFLRQ